MSVARRQFLLGSLAVWTVGSKPVRADDAIVRIEGSLNGRIGVSALNVATGSRFQHRGDERFAMCSTFKAALAASVLARADRGELSLARRISFGAKDILANSPVTKALVQKGALSIEALCAAAVEASDNTAANLLLSLSGGPAGLTAFFRVIGDDTTRLDRIELELNSNLPGDPRDTTTPDAMVKTLRALLVDESALSADSRRKMTDWMLNERNGRDRLRAGLPSDWRVANKPGTGANGATNDIAVAWPPQRPPFVISVYLDAPAATLAQRKAAIAEIARIVSST